MLLEMITGIVNTMIGVSLAFLINDKFLNNKIK